jgi:hypothetical protein
MDAIICSAVWAGLAVGNFLYQLFGQRLWAVAAERSYFQGLALLTVFVMARYLAPQE